MSLITTSLEMNTPADFRPAYSNDPMLTVSESLVPFAAFYRFLYGEVGRQWRWFDRNEWSDEQLEAHLAQPNIRVYVLYVNGTPAGYVELDQQAEGNTEVAYFGLMEKFFGRGYGKHLLSFAIQQAWDMGAKRVWVHTCNLDGPYALQNYQSRGFKIYDVQEKPMPAKYMTPAG
jgi:ribosomal protein S18 acetylase RimI-like enzyme